MRSRSFLVAVIATATYWGCTSTSFNPGDPPTDGGDGNTAEGGEGGDVGPGSSGGTSGKGSSSGGMTGEAGQMAALGGGGNDGGSGECGDGVRAAEEACDDGNVDDGDGCSSSCVVEKGFRCDAEEPSSCEPVCGDGLVVGAEARAGGCDDGNTEDDDGCGATCTVEEGYACKGAPSRCVDTCGDGELQDGEDCDDGNSTAGDGCNACAIEPGFTCDGPGECVDVDECATADPCGENEVCTNTPGSFTCECVRGYTRYETMCVPILQAIPGTVRTISADGKVAAGSARATAGIRESPSRWTQEGGLEFLIAKGKTIEQGYVTDASRDGSVLVGRVVFENDNGAFHWTANAGIVLMGLGKVSVATAVSANGAVIAGTMYGTDEPARSHGFRWTPATREQDLGPAHSVNGMSADGAVIIGRYDHSFRWTSASGTVNFDDPNYHVAAISGDGKVIVGRYLLTTSQRAFRYTAEQGFEDLPVDAWTGTRADVVNYDGSVIAGLGSGGTWIWDATNGARLFVDVLSERGVDMSAWSSMSPNAMSADGTVIVGTGYLDNEWMSWIARLN